MRVAQAVDREDVLALRNLAQDLIGAIRIGRQIVEIGLFGRVRECEEHALVLGWRQFLVDRHIENAGHRDDDQQHEGEYRPLLHRAVEHARIESPQRTEYPLDRRGRTSPASGAP